MAVVARIIGYSLLTAGLGALIGQALFGQFGQDTGYLFATVFACVGAVVGAVAGAAGEIVTSQRRLTRPEALKPMSKTFEVEN